MKNLFKGTAMILALLLGLSTIFPSIEAKAYTQQEDMTTNTITEDMPRAIEGRQWGQKVCPGMKKCYGCSASNCKVLKVQKISVRYSYSECVDVVNRTRGIQGSALISGIFATKKIKPIPAAFLSLWSWQIGDYSSHFSNAVARREGLTFTYELAISKNSYSLNQTRNARIIRS